jgi:hypothetical protein
MPSPGPPVRVTARVGALDRKWIYNGKQVDQGIARKAEQEPEGEMEGTETAAEAEARETFLPIVRRQNWRCFDAR